MRRFLTPGLAVLAFATCLSSVFAAGEWPRWRGPSGNGLSDETGIATQWSQDKNVAWSLKLPGEAGSTPIVWDDRIFLTTAQGDELFLMCLATEGKELWRQRIGGGNRIARDGEGNSASASPVTDGSHVWCFFGTGELACFDVDGNEAWQFNVQDRFGEFNIQFGMTSTPVLHEGALFLQLLHGDMFGPYTVAKVIKLDAATGETIWAVDRPSDGVRETKHSYASPVLYNYGGTQFLIVHGADYTTGHDLNDGHEIWRVGGLNGPAAYNPADYDPTFRFVSSPTAAEGLIVIPTAKNGPTVGVSVNSQLKGDVTGNDQVVRWWYDQTPDVSCPLIVDDLVYLCQKTGDLICLDAKTGEEIYMKRTHRMQHRASPIYVDGHIYLSARDGLVTVVKEGRDFEIVAQNELGETQTATPVVADGTLYIRTFEKLYAIRPEAK